MDAAAALRILGFEQWPARVTLTKRWRELIALHHPDHGGSTKTAAAINLAYQYLKR
jgi:curved DNA-binding protein CbpA